MHRKQDKCFVHLREIIEDVQHEHNRQIAKWGIQNASPFEWLCYLGEEVGELNKAIAENEYRGGTEKEVFKEAIQVSTLALKIAEMYREET